MNGENVGGRMNNRDEGFRQKEAIVGQTTSNHSYMIFFRPRKPPDFDCPGFFGSFSLSFFFEMF
jgi:hypothetical protein